MTRLIICGGGLAGGLAVMALARQRPDVELLLLEQGATFGGNHIWSFFDSDVGPAEGGLLDLVARRRWPDYDIRFPNRVRTIPAGYNSIQSPDLDAAIRTALRPDQYCLGAAVTKVTPDHVIVDGERIEGTVIDARGPSVEHQLELGWQKFVGRIYRYRGGHGIFRPTIMDATVPQIDGFRFVYLLPLSRNELLVEDTYYSNGPELDRAAIGGRLDEAAGHHGREPPEALSEESGVLPVVISGSLDDLWPADDSVPRLGLRGGFFHPTTGYSLPDAAANALAIAALRDLSPAAVLAELRSRAERQWKTRSFFQLLNRMLFRAAKPNERYRVLEHFYRLPPATIGRFYAAQLTTFDKVRILSGRPPVSIGRAMTALLRSAA